MFQLVQFVQPFSVDADGKRIVVRKPVMEEREKTALVSLLWVETNGRCIDELKKGLE